MAHDVMFCGPGRFGPYDEHVYRAVIERGGFTASKIGQVRRFACEVQPGDIVLMRLGLRVLAIGLVADEAYHHNPAFDDIYGWDLDHSRRVIWQHHVAEELAAVQSDGGLFRGRRQMATFESVNADHIVDPVRHLFGQSRERDLATLPELPPEPLTLGELEQALFHEGLAYDTSHHVCQAVAKVRRLIDWYHTSGMAVGRPAEHEVVAHVILPLLKALGWSEQLLAIEWHKIDLAVFWRTPTDERHCKLVCEAKAIGHGLQKVLRQAEGYVSRLGLDECDKILLTDGQAFYAYRRTEDGWTERPTGYLNIFKIRERHVCPAGTNGIDTLVSLTPARVAQ